MNYVEKLAVELRKRQRCKREVVIVILDDSALQVAAANVQGLCWQEECMLASSYSELTRELYWQEVEQQLRAVLLAHDVEEQLECVLLPAAVMFYEEKLELPFLSGRELQETVAWETQQCVPWPADSYIYTYWEKESVEPAARPESISVHLLALRIQEREAWKAIADKVLLKVEEVGRQGDLQELQRCWYEGKKTKWHCNVQKNLQAYLQNRLLQRLLRTVAVTMLFMSIMICGFAFAGRYLAQQELEDMQHELQQERAWQQHFAESKMLRQKIAKLQSVQKKLAAQQLRWSEELSILSKHIGNVNGCWLTDVEQQSADVLQLQGKARSNEAVQEYVHNLQQSGHYTEVKLLEASSSANHAVCTYKLQLVLQKGKTVEEKGNGKTEKEQRAL